MPPGSLQGLVLASEDLRADCERLVTEGVRFDRPLEEQRLSSQGRIRASRCASIAALSVAARCAP
jgi:hypothetical protein